MTVRACETCGGGVRANNVIGICRRTPALMRVGAAYVERYRETA